CPFLSERVASRRLGKAQPSGQNDTLYPTFSTFPSSLNSPYSATLVGISAKIFEGYPESTELLV
ncbi:hypothetical protein, partial [Brasilonema sp. UFV-L1]|uniref:hypothetical protein n=1 Tax=Brasilonema sp. UFV-L1 TaxID=2234130 RepID=UPI001B7D2820